MDTCDPGYCLNTPDGDHLLCTPEWDNQAPTGTPCAFLNACAPLMCAETSTFPAPECMGSPFCCAPFCHLDNGDADCQGLPVDGLACLPYFDDPMEAPPESAHVGVCGVP